MPSGGNPGSRRGQPRPESLWRLVDAKCSQLKDSVTAARIPFFLALLWGFTWFVANYNHDYGYTRTLVQRYQTALRDGHTMGYRSAVSRVSIKRYYLPALFDRCDSLAQAVKSDSALRGALSRCQLQAAASETLLARSLRTQLDQLLRQQVDMWRVPVLGIGVPVTAFDLGIVGQAGLVLLLFWFYFAVRRENHAIRSIIDLDEPAQDSLFPNRFVLRPNVKYLGPEHYAYAYHAVAHRFMFLTSSRAKPLLLTTVAMMALPFLSSSWHYYTDLRDLFSLPALGSQATIRTIVETYFWILILVYTRACIVVSIQTSVILNGWFLANRDCWEKDWDEEDTAVAKEVLIDRVRQVALYAENVSQEP